jgi:hypothetical protein
MKYFPELFGFLLAGSLFRPSYQMSEIDAWVANNVCHQQCIDSYTIEPHALRFCEESEGYHTIEAIVDTGIRTNYCFHIGKDGKLQDVTVIL